MVLVVILMLSLLILKVDSSRPIKSLGFRDTKVDCNPGESGSSTVGGVGTRGNPKGRVGSVGQGENHGGYKGVGGGGSGGGVYGGVPSTGGAEGGEKGRKGGHYGGQEGGESGSGTGRLGGTSGQLPSFGGNGENRKIGRASCRERV